MVVNQANAIKVWDLFILLYTDCKYSAAFASAEAERMWH